jgi:hypothetical protein
MALRAFFTRDIQKDLTIILCGAILAFIIVRLDSFAAFFQEISRFMPLASFTAGIFFTSALTLAPASIVLAKLSIIGGSTSEIALWGGLGAALGDVVIFLFIRDRVAAHLKTAFRKAKIMKGFFSSFHLGFMKWLSPIIGAFIIASPLPDELGLALMGLSKMKLIVLIPIAFIMNTLGIWGLISFVRLIG